MIDGLVSEGVASFLASWRSPPLGGSRLLASRFLSHDERRILSDAMGPPRWVRPRVDLLRQDDRADNLILITQGWAYRHMTTGSGELQCPALLVPGDIGNLDSLMVDRLGYGVRTITKAAVASLPRAVAILLADRYPGIARTFTWLAIAENLQLSQAALSLGRRSAREALAHLICELSVRLGLPGDGEITFAFPPTQEHIANTIGLTTVHVNRVIRTLHREGAIEVGRRQMTIPCMKGLRDIAGFDPSYLHHVGPALGH